MLWNVLHVCECQMVHVLCLPCSVHYVRCSRLDLYYHSLSLWFLMNCIGVYVVSV